MWKWMVYILMSDKQTVSVLVSEYGFGDQQSAKQHLANEEPNIQAFIDENDAVGIIDAQLAWELCSPDINPNGGEE